jgi:hypothetical protein
MEKAIQNIFPQNIAQALFHGAKGGRLKKQVLDSLGGTQRLH